MLREADESRLSATERQGKLSADQDEPENIHPQTQRDERAAGQRQILRMPSHSVTWASKLSAQAGADLPVDIHSPSDQLVPDSRVHAAVTWRF